jgi:hypothetical protein
MLSLPENWFRNHMITSETDKITSKNAANKKIMRRYDLRSLCDWTTALRLWHWTNPLQLVKFDNTSRMNGHRVGPALYCWRSMLNESPRQSLPDKNVKLSRANGCIDVWRSLLRTTWNVSSSLRGFQRSSPCLPFITGQAAASENNSQQSIIGRLYRALNREHFDHYFAQRDGYCGLSRPHCANNRVEIRAISESSCLEVFIEQACSCLDGQLVAVMYLNSVISINGRVEGT